MSLAWLGAIDPSPCLESKEYPFLQADWQMAKHLRVRLSSM